MLRLAVGKPSSVDPLLNPCMTSASSVTGLSKRFSLLTYKCFHDFVSTMRAGEVVRRRNVNWRRMSPFEVPSWSARQLFVQGRSLLLLSVFGCGEQVEDVVLCEWQRRKSNGIPAVNLESDSDWESEQNRTSFVILIPISCSPSGEIRNNYFTTSHFTLCATVFYTKIRAIKCLCDTIESL